MLRSVLTKTIWERRTSTLWWLVGLLTLALTTVAFYPSIRADQEAFTQLFEALPEGLLSVFGVDDASVLASPVGFINSRLYSSVGAIVLVIFAISAGTAAIAGEEDQRTMDLLLSLPIDRSRLVFEKFFAMTVMTFGLAASMFVVLVISNPIIDLDLSMAGMVAANVGVGLLALTFGTLALAIGGITGRRGLALGAPTGLAILTFFLHGLAPLVDSIAWTQRLTPFYWFGRSTPLANGFDVGFLLLLGTVGLTLAAAGWGFSRRDVGV